jgi:hypothetical protein
MTVFGPDYASGTFTGACSAFGTCLYNCSDNTCRNSCLAGDAGTCDADALGKCLGNNCMTECAGLGGGGNNNDGGNNNNDGGGGNQDAGPCGTIGVQCCPATSTTPPSCTQGGSTCDSNTMKCVSCGNDGEKCCPTPQGSGCFNPLACLNGTCGKCGDQGQACCPPPPPPPSDGGADAAADAPAGDGATGADPGPPTCHGSLTCGFPGTDGGQQNMCVTCGAVGEMCCPPRGPQPPGADGGAFDAGPDAGEGGSDPIPYSMDPNGASCVPWAQCGQSDTCVSCGGSGQPCCASNVAPYCHDGLTCDGGSLTCGP